MKNLSLLLNVVLIIAVGVLYFLHFSKNSNNEQKTVEEKNPVEYSVAYINSDSVLKNYEYFEKIQNDLQTKSSKLEQEYQSRAQGLQKEVNDYQQNMSNLTIGQAQALEENLRKKQQNLQLYQQKLSQDLMTEENKMSQQLYEKITTYLRGYSENNDLELVVKFNQGSDVLYATKGMDITDAVIEGLNDEYRSVGDTVAVDSTDAQ